MAGISPRRVIAAIVQCCLLTQMASCTSTRSVPVGPDLARQEPRVAKEPGLSISGYVTADGTLHPFVGTVTIDADTLVFHPTRQIAAATYPERQTTEYGPSFRLAQAEVTSLNHSVSHNNRTLLITAGVMVVLFVVLLLTADYSFGGSASGTLLE